MEDQDYQVTLETMKEEDSLFTDEHFPPERSSLCPPDEW